MEIKLAFSKSHLILTVPPSVKVDVYQPSVTKNPVTPDKFREAFHTSGADRFMEDTSLLIVVNDGYRHTPTAQILAWLEACRSGILERSTFLVATGTHQAPSLQHLQQIFGPFYERVRKRLHWHDINDEKFLCKLNDDPLGGEVYVNRLLFETSKVLVIGSVEPHYFAGFTGGCKSVIPGLADLATIERNHNLANSLQAAPLKIEGNPVAEHLWSLLEFFDQGKFFTLQLVVDSQHRIAGVFFGCLREAFDKARQLAEELYAPKTPYQYDIVLGELLPPLDKNLYQAQKAVENCQAAVADGGQVVVIAACEEGVGSDFFYRQADNWDRRQNRPRDGQIRFGSHKLSRIIEISKRIGVGIYSHLPEETVRRVFYEPVRDINRLITDNINMRKSCRVAVVHDAGHTVLKIK